MTIQLRTNWRVPLYDPATVESIAAGIGVHPLTARLLVIRGVCDSEQACDFLAPSLAKLHDPMLLPDMDRASDRIVSAITQQEKIFVYGDYDVDGVTSAAVYVRTLRSLKCEPIYKVPHRKNDGYDLRPVVVDSAHSLGAGLIITSDCGILAHEAVLHANSLGIDVVITDHHEPGDLLPPAYAVVNPHRADSDYPFPHLAGVGIAFKTMQAVVRKLMPDFEANYIARFVDLVSCGTVADVMPLRDENRILVWHGLKLLAETKKPGLLALLNISQANGPRPVTTETIGFGIAPRINAVGRLDDAGVALELMLTQDRTEAEALAMKLNGWNIERQAAQKQILAQAMDRVIAENKHESHVIVLAGEGWNPGVVGIVAGKISETYYRPAIVIGLDASTGIGKGSARSIPGFDIISCIRECSALLTSCGGHEMAAGIGLAVENVDLFEQAMNIAAAGKLSEDELMPSVRNDGEVAPSEITVDLLRDWERLAPFGEKNPAPRFTSMGVLVQSSRRMGNDQSHLKLQVGDLGSSGTECVGWRMGHLADTLNPGVEVDILYSPQINEWKGNRSVQFIVEELRLSEAKK